MIKKAFIVAAVVGAVGLLIFGQLGGFNEIMYRRIESVSYIIIGKEYRGAGNSSELEELFNESRTLIEEKIPNGVLVIVSYEHPDQARHIIHYFIGVLLDEIPDNLPNGFDILEINAPGTVSALIEASSLVMPTSTTVRKGAKEYLTADESLNNFSIEKYLEEGMIEIDFPIMKD